MSLVVVQTENSRSLRQLTDHHYIHATTNLLLCVVINIITK